MGLRVELESILEKTGEKRKKHAQKGHFGAARSRLLTKVIQNCHDESNKTGKSRFCSYYPPNSLSNDSSRGVTKRRGRSSLSLRRIESRQEDSPSMTLKKCELILRRPLIFLQIWWTISMQYLSQKYQQQKKVLLITNVHQIGGRPFRGTWT